MSKGVKWAIGVVAVLIVVLGAWTLFASMATDDTPVVEEEVTEDTSPIVVGFISPLTGDAAAYGEPGQKVTQLAVDEINAAGGINGRDLQVIYEDGKCNGKDAASAMQKLVNVDKVQAVIGGFCSSESLAAAPIANANKVLLFSPGSSSPDLTNAGPYFFRDYPSDASQGAVFADVAYNTKEWRKVAVIQEQLDYPLGIYNAFNAAYSELGGEVVRETFAPETSDFRTGLTKLEKEEPDALLISVQTPASAETILKQLGDIDWAPNLIGVDIIPGSDIPKDSPELVEGMLTAEFGVDPDNEIFQNFALAYKIKYGEEVPFASYAQAEYDAVYVLAEALKAVGNDGMALQGWFAAMEPYDGASGSVEFDENGDRTVGHRAEVILDGKVLSLEEALAMEAAEEDTDEE